MVGAEARGRFGRLAVCAGNALEFYEFLIYSNFALYIGMTFFPPDMPGGTLLPSLATFGAGFLTRPIGGWAIGRLSDRVGRKAGLLLSLGLMGVAMAGLALTPGYARIGIAAPILLLLFRLVQGFALGGEVGPATAFLVESADERRHAQSASLQGTTQGVGILAAALVGFLLALILPANALQAWGWRLSLLPALLVVPVAWFVRRSLPETLHQTTPRAAADHPGDARLILCALLVIGASTIGTYTGTYATTYALTTLHMPPRISFAAGLMIGLSIIVVAPIAGRVSDRVGRKPVLLFCLVATALTSIPGFWMIVHYPSPAMLLGMLGLITFASAGIATPLFAALTEAFPPHRRSTIFCCTYAVAITIFGGTTQYAVAWLIQRTGDPMMPAYYRTGAVLVGIAAALMMAETAPGAARRGRRIGAVLPI